MDMDGFEDQELISMELLQMQNESYWLIQREVPIVCKRVKTIVNKCLELLHPIDIQENKDKDKDKDNIDKNNNTNNSKKQVPITIEQTDDNEVNELFDILKFNQEDSKKLTTQKFETNEGSRGILVLNGWNIDSNDLQIKTKSKTNNPVMYKDTISKSAPWRLNQIQNAYNHLQFVESELTSIINFSERYTPTYINTSNNNSLTGSSYIPNNNNNNIENGNAPSTSWSWVNQPNRNSLNVGGGNNNIVNNINNNNNNNNSNNGGVVSELLSLFETIKSIGEWISLAKDELLLPSKDVFPITLFQRNLLKNLPPDLHIDITVANCDIVFSIHELQISSSDSGQNLGGIGHGGGASGSIGSVGSHHGTNLSGSSSSPSKFLRKSANKLVGGGSPHPQHMQQQVNGGSSLSMSGSNQSSSQQSNSSSQQSQSQSQSSSSQPSSSLNTPQSNQPQLSQSSSSIPRNSSGNNLSNSNNNNSNNSGTGNNNNQNGNTTPPNMSTLLESEQDFSTNPPDQYSKKTYQMNKQGSVQWVTVVEHSESRIPIKKLSDTFALMTGAYDKLADLSEKFMVLSNTS